MTDGTDDDAATAHDDRLDRATAVERVLALRAETLADHRTERVGIDTVAGRTLAEAVVAEADVPPRSRATMDGYAFDATDGYPLAVRDGQVHPEDDPPALGEGEAVRIATGAALPEGANAVLMVEDATVSDGQLDGPPIDPGTDTYERGSNVAAGETLVPAGERLSPKDAILLADLGRETVPVREPFRVGLLATGTEIHEGRQPDRDSPMLAGLVRSWGHAATYEGTVPDDYDRVVERVAALATEYDVVVTTGGTSVGDADHAVRALAELGEVLFHRVAVRPGTPIAVAQLPDAVAVAIPGKPVGAHAIATLVARPFFAGATRLAAVDATMAVGVGVEESEFDASGFEYAIPVTLDDAEGESSDGTVRAMPLGHADSALPVYDDVYDPSVLSSSTRATRADGFVITETGVEAGERVWVVPYPVVE